jgi:hypothetical protein
MDSPVVVEESPTGRSRVAPELGEPTEHVPEQSASIRLRSVTYGLMAPSRSWHQEAAAACSKKI